MKKQKPILNSFPCKWKEATNKQAFTLVELIVVITILAILGTIGFISLQGFSSDARDSKRISEIGEIRSGLQIYQARNSLLPTPSEQIVTVGSGTTDLIIQGYAGISVLNEIRMNGEPKDPLEKEYYTYSVNANKTKFQLLALLENDNNLTSFNNLNIIPTTHASYINRYPYTVGGGTVGILLDETTNTPLQKLATSVDLNTDTNNYKVVFSNNNEVSTLSGELLYNEIITQTNNNGTNQNNEPQLTGWRALDPNCEIEDITIGTQTWAGCNSTLGDGFEWGQTNANIGTSSYSGSIFSCYLNYEGTDNSSEPTCQPGHTKMASNAKANDWFNGTNLNNDSEYDTIWGKLYTWNQAMGNSPYTGACPTGRKLPSDLEWEYAEEYLYDELNPGTAPNNCRNTTNGWLCDGLGWSSASGTKSRSLANELKIPLAGYRSTDGSTFFNRGNYAHLWSSTPSSTSAFRRHLLWNNSTVNRNASSQTFGFSVRCIKD